MNRNRRLIANDRRNPLENDKTRGKNAERQKKTSVDRRKGIEIDALSLNVNSGESLKLGLGLDALHRILHRFDVICMKVSTFFVNISYQKMIYVLFSAKNFDVGRRIRYAGIVLCYDR